MKNGLGKTGKPKIQKRIYETEAFLLPAVNGGFEGVLQSTHTYLCRFLKEVEPISILFDFMLV